jgi:hypothetical protein
MRKNPSHSTVNVHHAKRISFDRMDVSTFQSYKIRIDDENGGAFEVSAFVDNGDVPEFEKQWNDEQLPPLVSEDIVAVINALRVFMLDPTVRAVLDRIDPKGVEQAQAALKRAGREV